MRRLVCTLAFLAALSIAPQPLHETAITNDAEATALPALAGGPIQPLAEGLYALKGVDTRRGLQCVEYVERYYVTHYPDTFPFRNSGPGAYDIWEGIADGKAVGGWPDRRDRFVAYENGTAAPQPEDMLLYDRTRGEGYGHIALIAEVYPTAVVILEQNSGWDTKKVLPLVENRIFDRGVKGIIRLKSNDL